MALWANNKEEPSYGRWGDAYFVERSRPEKITAQRKPLMSHRRGPGILADDVRHAC